MKAVGALPEGYKEIYSIDLQKNKKMSLFINLLAVIIAVLLLITDAFMCTDFFFIRYGERIDCLYDKVCHIVCSDYRVHNIARTGAWRCDENLRDSKGEIRIYGLICLCRKQ